MITYLVYLVAQSISVSGWYDSFRKFVPTADNTICEEVFTKLCMGGRLPTFRLWSSGYYYTDKRNVLGYFCLGY